MPAGDPTRTPIPVETPTVAPDTEREYEADPEKLCPAQKIEITRRIAPLLP